MPTAVPFWLWSCTDAGLSLRRERRVGGMDVDVVSRRLFMLVSEPNTEA